MSESNEAKAKEQSVAEGKKLQSAGVEAQQQKASARESMTPKGEAKAKEQSVAEGKTLQEKGVKETPVQKPSSRESMIPNNKKPT